MAGKTLLAAEGSVTQEKSQHMMDGGVWKVVREERGRGVEEAVGGGELCDEH